MKFNKKRKVFVAAAALVVFLLLATGPGRTQPTAKVDKTIQYLIGYVSGSGLTFTRNAREYTPSEAAQHMNRKYQHFRDVIKTPEDFIEMCATKSLLSGEPYTLIDRRGMELRTSDWLRLELAAYRVRGQ